MIKVAHPFFESINTTATSSKSSDRDDKKRDKRLNMNKFCQAIALCKLEIAWEYALQVSKRQCWYALAHKALQLLQMDIAIRVFCQLGDACKVMQLNDLRNIEDKLLLSGEIILRYSAVYRNCHCA